MAAARPSFPTAVVLDFFGTLVEVDEDAPTMAELLTSLGYECSEMVELLWNSRGFDGLTTPTNADGGYTAWREVNLRNLALMAGVAEGDVDDVVRLLLENDRKWTVRATPGSDDFVGSLTRLAIPHTICSNWDYEIDHYLEQAQLPRIPAITSANTGHRKPATQIVELALQSLCVEAAKSVWFVGDSWEADAVPALRLGLWPVVISSSENPLPGHVTVVPSLSDLKQILDDLVGQAASERNDR